MIYRSPLLGYRFWPERWSHCETSPLKLCMMFSQDMLGKILGARARVCVNVYLSCLLKPKTISPMAMPERIYCTLFHSKTDHSLKSILCVCGRETGIFSWPFTDGRQHRRMNPAVVLFQNVITEGGKVRLQGWYMGCAFEMSKSLFFAWALCIDLGISDNNIHHVHEPHPNTQRQSTARPNESD